MYVAYLDESESHDKSRVIVAAAIVRDKSIRKLENILAFLREFFVSAECDKPGPLSREQSPWVEREFDEFHTSDLFNGRGQFKGITQPDAIRIIRKEAQLIAFSEVAICYCSVDTTKLKSSLFGNAEAKTVGLRSCLKNTEKWMVEHALDECVLAICDDMTSGRIRSGIQESFRDLRKTIKRVGTCFGELEHFHDDMYFGDSKYCAGLQIADVCAFIINRHLANKPETEECFKLIENRIFAAANEPDASFTASA